MGSQGHTVMESPTKGAQIRLIKRGESPPRLAVVVMLMTFDTLNFKCAEGALPVPVFLQRRPILTPLLSEGGSRDGKGEKGEEKKGISVIG